MPGRNRIASLVAAGLLAFPAAAAAQSAGDEQYQDPFAPEPGKSDGGDGSTGSSGGGTTGSSGGGSTGSSGGGATEPAPAAQPEAGPATTAQTPDGSEQLPRTGADAGPLALGGTLLLAGGIALRVRLSAPAPRRR